MRNVFTLAILVILAWTASTKKIWAQETEAVLYYVVDYMKVAPGMPDEVFAKTTKIADLIRAEVRMTDIICSP